MLSAIAKFSSRTNQKATWRAQASRSETAALKQNGQITPPAGVGHFVVGLPWSWCFVEKSAASNFPDAVFVKVLRNIFDKAGT